MSSSPTMNDVARVAGVALKTVSRYVNGETNINPQMAERIRDAITSLGYRRNLAAASIRPGRTSRVIGLVIGDLSNPYYSTIARAVESVVDAHGFLLTTASSDENGDRHDRLVDRLMEQRVDALIIVPPKNVARTWDQVPPPVPPLVLIDRPAPGVRADVVLADNAGGAFAATQELLAQGSERVAFVGDALTIYTMSERHRGYLSALEHAGAVHADALVHTRAHSLEDAAAIVTTLLENGSADAIFAANNRAAIGAVLAFRTLGRRVPLIGFDDFEAAPLVTPAVSVVSQDVALMGRTAAELALSRIDGDSSEPTVHTLDTRLILRGSELRA
ncbi:LacI family transcriptional regulator [Microbacterium saperdae]|uniref:LacI family transcriptional regulator n=2 Tax=Microbacterium saperdae TaxID=69368 RepID=A0A543BIT4_9MICO|nr:LacI family transcriptional regulator [Microbacterium saperdae]